MASYLIVKVLENSGPVLPSTTVYRDVEIRSAKSDTDIERKLIEESIKSNDIDLSLNSRMGCIVEADNLSSAVVLADDKFTELLDLKSREYTMSKLALTDYGFAKNLDTLKLEPLVIEKTYELGNVFVMQPSIVQTYNQTQYVLFHENELTERYKRSLHWSRNSKHEKSLHLKVIFDWFAVEALLKEDQNDNIAPYIRWFLGFPNGKSLQFLNQEFKRELENHPEYQVVARKLETALEEIRVLRNDSIHHGSRKIDYSPRELYFYNQVMLMGAARCQDAMLRAIGLKLNTLEEFKDYISCIFEQKEHLISDVHGTVIHLLAKEMVT
ncbi:hypothetical protein HJ014_22775 [Vibrio parahaemolyticus]|nr:hypothetical protein [Vibrio parahaemolyticus]